MNCKWEFTIGLHCTLGTGHYCRIHIRTIYSYSTVASFNKIAHRVGTMSYARVAGRDIANEKITITAQSIRALRWRFHLLIINGHLKISQNKRVLETKVSK